MLRINCLIMKACMGILMKWKSCWPPVPAVAMQLRVDLVGRVLDRLYNVVVAGATAQVSGESVAYLLFRGVRVFVQQI